MDPATIAAVASAITSIGSGLLGKGESKETKLQKKKRELIDDLLASVQGKGPYSDLYNWNEDVFNKSFVDPAKALFRNQIAPQIQQQYISGGQQYSSGLDDQLLRAGIDLDQMLNQYMMQSYESNLNRKQSALNAVLGVDKGAEPTMSTGEALKQSAAGYLTSDEFKDLIAQISKKYGTKSNDSTGLQESYRRGFEQD